MTTDSGHSVADAQALRLKRMMWGLVSQAFTFVVVAGLYSFGLVPLDQVLQYVAMIVLIDIALLVLLKSNFNLRFRDPSLTAAQIIAPMWPAIYLMFFVTDPQARTTFLLLATGGLLYGMFALSRRGMLVVGGVILGAYLVLLINLHLLAPERIDWRVESVVVFAYASVLALVAYLGSYIAGLRSKLREQNVRLQDLATRDSLTQLPNRRSVMERLAQEKSRAQRRDPDQNALCVSMLDVDHFKDINDTWGHDVGDAVLCRISQTLQDSMRQGDFTGRFGGEEFVIILPETAPEVARSAVLRVQGLVGELSFPELPDGKRVTISQGVAVHQENEDILDTLKRADQALYQAKHAGRNQVVFSFPDTDQSEDSGESNIPKS